MASQDHGLLQEQILTGREDIQSRNEALGQTEKYLFQSENNCSYRAEENDGSSSYTTFLTSDSPSNSQSFSSCAPSMSSLASSCADLDEGCNIDTLETMVNPDQSIDCSSTCNIASKENQQLYDSANENGNLSWIGRSLCGINSSSMLENIDDSMALSFHTAICSPGGSQNTKRNIDSQLHATKEKLHTQKSNSTCLVCLKELHVCDCLDNVVDCTY